jgi:hypothetical protein
MGPAIFGIAWVIAGLLFPATVLNYMDRQAPFHGGLLRRSAKRKACAAVMLR